MKKFSFLALAAVGLLFSACSSDKDVAENGSSSPFNGNGDGYVGISISLPSAEKNSTRANDDFVNGKADEFEVYAAHLYLFKGTSEANATFLKRYSLAGSYSADTEGEKNQPEKQDGVTFIEDNTTPGSTHTGTGVTSTSTTVCKIDKPNLGSNKLYAYVVINPQGALSSEPSVGTPFTTFATQKLNAADNGGTLEGAIAENLGLLMTNSPISDKGAGSAAPSEEKLTTLVELKPENIKNSADEALAAPAGCIYVERSAAKVTLNTTIADADKKITMAGSDLTYTITGWQIINTEPKFYNARQIESTWDPLTSQYMAAGNTKYRFITKYDFAPTKGSGDHTTGYRTYFAKDIQYDSDATLDYTVAGGKVKGTTTDRAWLSVGDRAFVPENTFDVDRQQRKNTTQVTLKVTFGDGDDIYTLSDDAKYYKGKDNVQTAIAAKVQGAYKFNKFLNDYIAYQIEKLHEATPAKYYKVNAVATAQIDDDSEAANAASYTVGYGYAITESDAVDGTYSASTATPVALSDQLASDWASAKAEAEVALTVSLYKGGASYYNIRIKHFGESETPWDAARGVQPGSTIEQIYGPSSTRTADYLGRYGVVRDNWYNLSIDGIAKLGTAEPKPVNGDPTPDDEIVEEHYISAHVHILPWVLRTQSVTF